jgi:hypothetical protein
MKKQPKRLLFFSLFFSKKVKKKFEKSKKKNIFAKKNFFKSL